MSNYTDQFDSVFDKSTEDELDFDVMFDEDDALVDSVEGIKEDGTPLTGDEFEGIHLSDDEPGKDLATTNDLDDKTTPDDVKDALGDQDETLGTKKIEDGSEQKIGDNTDNEKKDAKGDDLAWFEDEDDKYQDADFSDKVVDPEEINKAIDSVKECDDVAASEDVAGKTSDKLDIECECDPEERKDETATDDGVGEFEGKTDVAPKSEASAFLEAEAEDSTDVTEENPMAPESLDDEDLPNDADPDQDKDAIAKEAAEVTAHAPKMMLPKDECGDSPMPTDAGIIKDVEENVDNDVEEGAPEDELKEASAFLESDDEGIIADNDEGEAHKEVQCDGTENCQCPACKANRAKDNTDPNMELAVGDLAEAAGADADVEEIVDDEVIDADEDLIDVDPEVEVEDDLSYDPSDEDLIDIALSDDDDEEI